jgi:hypothetical protein
MLVCIYITILCSYSVYLSACDTPLLERKVQNIFEFES